MMKKIGCIAVITVLIIALTACAAQNNTQPNEAASEQPNLTDETPAQTDGEPEATENPVYAFELTDINGNVHKLSDYAGKPVYLRVWASWCGICTQSLDSLDELAGKAEDYTVLSVVMPSMSGEMNKEDFIEWYNEFGYKNLVVMLDETGQIVRDFGINAFPTQIMFDTKGRVVYGVAGLMPEDLINETMNRIKEEEK